MTGNEPESANEAVDSEESETQVVELEVRAVDIDRACATITVLRSLNSIREDIEDGELGTPFIELVVRVERELHERLDSHVDKIDSELGLTGFVKDETGLQDEEHGVGWYVSNANRVGLVDNEYAGVLDKLAEERKQLVHETGYVEELRSNESKRDEVEQLLLETIDFLDDAEQ